MKQAFAEALAVTRHSGELTAALKDAHDALRCHAAWGEEEYEPGAEYDDLVERGLVSIYRGTYTFPCIPEKGEAFVAAAMARAGEALRKVAA